MSSYCIVQTSLSDSEQAHQLASQIIEKKLGGCVQVSSSKTSYYRWDSKIQKEQEYVLSIKTATEKFDELKLFIQEKHPYEVPEIILIPIDDINDEYAKWLSSEIN